MYVKGDSYDGYGGLAESWGFGNGIPAKDVIPKQGESVTASEADVFLSNSGIGKRAPSPKGAGGAGGGAGGDIYWTKVGPMVAKRAVYGGKKVEKVAPPPPLKESRIRTERDLPIIDFPPVASALGGLSELKNSSALKVLGVLGLLFLVIRWAK